MLTRIVRYDDYKVIEGIDDSFWHIFDEYMAGDLGAVKFLKSRGVDNIKADHSFNVFNASTIRLLRDMGITGAVLSPELTVEEIRDIIDKSSLPLEAVVYGRIPLMIMEYCPVGSDNKGCRECIQEKGVLLKDRLGLGFPIRKTGIGRCYTEVLNSTTLYIGDEIKRINRLGIDIYGLKLEEAGPAHISKAIKLHRWLIDNPNMDMDRDIERISDRIKQTGFTRGHFFRGVE